MPFSVQNAAAAAAAAAMFGGGVIPQHLLNCASIAQQQHNFSTTQQQQFIQTTAGGGSQQSRMSSAAAAAAANLAANIRFASSMCQFFPAPPQISVGQFAQSISPPTIMSPSNNQQQNAAFLSMFGMKSAASATPMLTSISTKTNDNSVIGKKSSNAYLSKSTNFLYQNHLFNNEDDLTSPTVTKNATNNNLKKENSQLKLIGNQNEKILEEISTLTN